MSPPCRLVSNPARSPGLSITGPEVMRTSLCNSCPIICARLVLPNPGGPHNNTCLRASSRFAAAPTITCNRSIVFGCPVKSSKDGGRKAASTSLVGDNESSKKVRPLGGSSVIFFASQMNQSTGLRKAGGKADSGRRSILAPKFLSFLSNNS